MFSNPRKNAQQTAQQLISGHYTLIVWWALKHAGVFDAIIKMEATEKQGLDPLVHATRTSMSADILAALLDYLATSGLIAIKDKKALLTPEGKSLLEHEDGVLELMRSYEPVVEALEHLLAKLKAHGPAIASLRKADAALSSQSSRYATEVFPAIRDVIEKGKFTHLLDVACGSGDLLVHLATQIRQVVGVGISADGILVRQANKTINEASLDKRLIAVAANPLDVCMDTKRVFDRIGISPQLWEEIDCVIAPGICGEIVLRDAMGEFPGKSSGGTAQSANDAVIKVLSAIPRNFRKSHLLLVEPTASPRFEKNYYAAELSFLLRLCKSTPWTPEQWRDIIAKSKLKLIQESPLTTDGLTLFLCKTG